MWRIINRMLIYLEVTLSVTLLVAATAVLFTNVVLRYFFSAGFSWGEEFIAYCMIWATFIGAAICARKKSHVAMKLILDSLKSESSKRYYQMVLTFVAIIFCSWVVYLGIKQVYFLVEMGQKSPAMRLPMFIPYLSVPIGFLLMTVRYLEEIISLIMGVNQVKKEINI